MKKGTVRVNHSIKRGDLKDHLLEDDCWCKPIVSMTKAGMQIVHRPSE